MAWLNELPAAQALLAAEFGGAAINEQNLTNWKQGGYRDWRLQQEVQAFAQQTAGTAAALTTEQLTTILAVRYVAVIREWQQSPMPMERRWRQMRMILQDVMKMRREEHREQRLELDWERLQFAVERFEEEKQTDERRVMVGFLAAARQWPEVQAALAAAFRMFRERREAETEGNKAKLKPIKVNQGEINLKTEEMPAESVGCPPSYHRDGARRSRLRQSFGAAGRRKDKLAGQRPALPAVGTRMDVNEAKSGSIKVDQGGIFYRERERVVTIRLCCATARQGMRRIRF
ncbi:MAG: hypothetical protein JF609_07570, partial [Verrucomicrobia bacterium]|nr:hypothetical protein [Verrucomicrobiota bacterium]